MIYSGEAEQQTRGCVAHNLYSFPSTSQTEIRGQNGAKLKRGLVWKAEKKTPHTHIIFTYTTTTALDTWLEIHGGHLTDDVTACLLCPPPPSSFPLLPPSSSFPLPHKLTSAAQKRHIRLSCAAAFNQDRNCNWNKESSGPIHVQKKKKEKKKKLHKECEATGSFFVW